MSDCLTDDSLVLLLDGKLSGPEMRAVHEHVDTCDGCRLLLVEAVQDLSFAPPLGAMPESLPAPEPPQTAQAILAKHPQIGAYRLLHVLGEGGMGVVFAAEQISIGRRVAIKVLHRRLSLDPEFRARFFNEARAVNIIHHPGIVGIFEFGELSDGGLYLVMEHLEGRPLRSAWPISNDPAKRAMELGLLRQVASALQAAHDKGIVHRDLKPENVMVVPDSESAGGQRIKVLDFGLAKLGSGLQLQFHTRSDAMMGTPRYMSPEQCRGAGEVDAKTDVYALGVMLYEALTAHPPFYATGPGELLAKHIYEEAPRPLRRNRSIPAALDALVTDMLAKRSSDRPTMAEVAARLAQVIAELPRQLAPTSRLPRWVLLLVLFILGSAGAIYLARESRNRVRARPAPTTRDSATASVTASAGMIQLPGGTFTMGSSAEEVEAAFEFCRRLVGSDCQRDFYEREQPPRRIVLSPFLIDTTEVTNEQFAAWLNQQPGLEVLNDRLVKDGALLLADIYPAYGYSGLRLRQSDVEGADPNSQAPPKSADRFAARLGLEHKPVVQISWFAADRYCRAQGGRLPTEAEWEFAARGSHGYRFPWGDNEPSCDGVVFGRLHSEACAHSGVGPMAVGKATQDRSMFGVQDLGGNVSEWVSDTLQVPYPACPPPCRDPVNVPGPGSGAERTAPRVVRGGNWYLAAESCRGAARSRLPGDQVKGNIGFRCARSVKSN